MSNGTKYRGMLFAPEMARAVWQHRKTQTRRAVKPQPDRELSPIETIELQRGWSLGRIKCPHPPGSIVYVKERLGWACHEGQITHGIQHPPEPSELVYHVDGIAVKNIPDSFTLNLGRDVSSLHMPRWAARTWLRITNVRVERVQDIGDDDILAEGYPGDRGAGYSRVLAQEWYWRLWQQINGAGSWAANPWVWVYEFARVERPEGI